MLAVSLVAGTMRLWMPAEELTRQPARPALFMQFVSLAEPAVVVIRGRRGWALSIS